MPFVRQNVRSYGYDEDNIFTSGYYGGGDSGSGGGNAFRLDYNRSEDETDGKSDGAVYAYIKRCMS